MSRVSLLNFDVVLLLQCVPMEHYCDEVVHCLDQSDEKFCLLKSNVPDVPIIRPHPPAIVDFDGKGSAVYTPLTAGGSSCSVTPCPETHFQCPGDGYCLPVYVRCNGVIDCPGRQDEDGCDGYACPGFFRCRGFLGACLHVSQVCDGWPQCPQHDDERFCGLVCPENCTCLGLAFTCTGAFPASAYPGLRYLDAGGSGMTPEVVRHNSLLIHLSLAKCSLRQFGNVTLPNLRSLDLSDNLLSVLAASDLRDLGNLRALSLAGNPVSLVLDGDSDNSAFERIITLDLARVATESLELNSSLPFPNLQSLNLSHSGVNRLQEEGFQPMKSLRVLDVRGCPLTIFPKDLFSGLGELRAVYADNYKLCCPETLPAGFDTDRCLAPFDEVSSCDALLRSHGFRVALVVLATLALSGNLGCFCVRVFALKAKGNTGYSIFVVHLCVSDFLMGAYLVVLGAADRLYLGSYLWEDLSWRRSVACSVAGFLALLSSEVSALLICLITLDRLLVIRFPFSRLRFSQLSAQVACASVWVLGVVMAGLPLLPVLSHWEFYGQTGICIPLPVTKTDFPGRLYAFAVMIIVNLVVFLFIAVGQTAIYVSVTGSVISSKDTSRKSREFLVARRLITVVVSDFLCWFPIGLLGLLAHLGTAVPGEVNVGMAIFVLPLNSALNPFLYTLNMIQERRHRAREERLLKSLLK